MKSWMERFFAVGATVGLLALASPQATAESLIIGGPQFAPLYMDRPDGDGTGTMVKLIREIAEEAGYTDIRAQIRPALRSQVELTSGESEVSILVIQETFTEDKFWRSEEPVTFLELNLYSMGEPSSFSSLDEIRDTPLIVIDGYSYGGWRNKLLEEDRNVTFLAAGTQTAAVQQLVRRRGPIALLYNANVDEAQAEMGDQFPVMATRNLLQVPLYLYVSRAAENADDKIRHLSEALTRRAAN